MGSSSGDGENTSERSDISQTHEKVDADDPLGLRELWDSGRVFFYRSPHEHDSLDEREIAGVLAPFLRAEGSGAVRLAADGENGIRAHPYKFSDLRKEELVQKSEI